MGAFIGKSKKVHPDRNANASAQEEFKRLNEAYTTLKNVSLRREYDATLNDQGMPDGTKNRYFKDDKYPVIYDRVRGIIIRDDGSRKYQEGRAPTFKLDPAKARKKHALVILGLISFGFLYAFSNMAYLWHRHPRKKSDDDNTETLTPSNGLLLVCINSKLWILVCSKLSSKF